MMNRKLALGRYGEWVRATTDCDRTVPADPPRPELVQGEVVKISFSDAPSEGIWPDIAAAVA